MGRWFLLVAALAAVSVAVLTPVLLSGIGPAATPARGAPIAGLPPYWTVHEGDSYGVIAHETGLTVDDLEAFNPLVNPNAIVPGQTLKLRLHVPAPPRRPKGPVWATVHSGDTFDSIARRTHHSVEQLQRLNPKLHVATLQPGARMRLRAGR